MNRLSDGLLDEWESLSLTREFLRFVERGLLLGMGSVAVGGWGVMVARLLADLHPLMELATHTSFHIFIGCVIVLLLELVFWGLRHRSINAAPRWRRRLVFTLVPLVYFGWVTSPWRMLPLRGTVESDRAIKVLSWNMLLVNHHHDEVMRLIESENPDVVCLIELSPAAANALQGLRDKYPYGQWLPAWEGCGIAMISRLPGSTYRTLFPANTWMAAIELNIPGRTDSDDIDILTVHTVSPHVNDSSRTIFRDKQLRVLGKWSHDKPHGALLIGDMNITPWSPPFRRLLRDGGLHDSSWYRGYFPSWPTLLGYAGIPIDHALVNESCGSSIAGIYTIDITQITTHGGCGRTATRLIPAKTQ